MVKTATLIVLVAIIGISQCTLQYQGLIPNGAAVPDPCHSGNIWAAVGHYNPNQGSLLTNRFAKDFAAAGHKWTQALCMMDSDEDGYSNGAELGDPACTWTPGTFPQEKAYGHPGICEPIGQGHCHHQHFSCDCLETCPNLH